MREQELPPLIYPHSTYVLGPPTDPQSDLLVHAVSHVTVKIQLEQPMRYIIESHYNMLLIGGI